MDPYRDVLFVDIETASLADLKACGAWAYSRHPSTRVYCVAFGYEWKGELALDNWDERYTLLPSVCEFIRAGGLIVAHNVSFERSIWENILVPRFDFPPVESQQWRDTQAMGLALNLPSTLEGLALALGCKVRKDTKGAAKMRQMAHAVEVHNDSYSYPLATRSNLDDLIDYCMTDVRATHACYKAMAPLSMMEQRVWLADQTINARGVYLDREFAKQCLRISKQRKQQLDDEVFCLTGGELSNVSAPPAFKKWLKEQGVTLPKLVRVRVDGTREATETLGALAVQDMLKKLDLPPVARRALELRRESSKVTSLAKLQRVATMVDQDDGRLRFALQYHGAHTGRWASYGLQLHNLPKVKLTLPALELARLAVGTGDLHTLQLCEDQPLRVLSQLLRSVIAAPPGKELIAGDFAAIEARVIAWLAGQLDVLSLFRDGRDVYTHAARKVGSDDRQLGKICTLALGFGMGALKFANTAAAWGVTLELKDAKRISTAWRDSNHDIVCFWAQLEEAAHTAVANPGTVQRAGRIQCRATDYCLMVQLPSGRVLRYWRPSLVRTTKKVHVVDDDGAVAEIEFETTELRFFAVGKDKTRMAQESTYGGKLAENVTQAVARDLLAEAILRLEGHWPYEVVVHVHDSLACEVPAGHGDVEEFCWLMEKTPAWAAGLPVAVDGYRATRFRG